MPNTNQLDKSGNRGSVLPFFLMGLGTGVALTFLFAPQSGVATRNVIATKVKDGQDWIKEKAAAAENYVTAQSAGVRDGLNEAGAALAQS